MESLKLVGFVKRSKNRKKVLLALDKPMMPSELVAKIYGSTSNTHFNIVSRALSELREKGLVEVVNPEDRTGRIYQKTKSGEKTLANIASKGTGEVVR